MNLNIDNFFETQLAEWSECADKYAALSSALHKCVKVGERSYDVMFNPARIKSASAKIDNGKVDRPCFLCPSARPAEQKALQVVTEPLKHEYEVLVNPYPILDHHFTIVCKDHTRQEIKGRLWDMAYFVDIFQDYLIFFNGACSGASAPDHMHFQAVPKSLVPLLSWSKEARLEIGVTEKMPNISDSDNKNIVAWTEGDRTFWLVINRKTHRPWQYSAEGEEKCLISPAALEFCGVIPLAREEDYNKMNSDLLDNILNQCSANEPLLKVGIIDAKQIFFSAEERVHAMTYIDENKILDVLDYSTNRSEKTEINEFWTDVQPFTLEGVTIGKQFHWEQKEDQVFNGSLHVIAKEGELHAINLIPIEEYLKSVISSEMSATNNLELLKTHAIISRSWVLRQLELKKSLIYINNVETPTFEGVSSDDVIVKWWDHDDHKLYDVCADDHCQRYQGITRQVSPLVKQAVDETRGEVLIDNNNRICDARFSKCCGGKSETFDTCWQDIDYDYLQPVEDEFCNTKDEEVLKLVLNDYDQKTIDFHDWTVKYSQDAISDLFEKKTGLGVGTIEELVPLKIGASGRIAYLKVVGSKRTVVIGKELYIRKAFSESHLYSSAFVVDKHQEEGKTVFVLNGKGWGHGVGLCQIGAACMSTQGFDYRQILSHYFNSASIAKIY